jgi:hypothetical protein
MQLKLSVLTHVSGMCMRLGVVCVVVEPKGPNSACHPGSDQIQERRYVEFLLYAATLCTYISPMLYM